jgi:hypothetical protein
MKTGFLTTISSGELPYIIFSTSCWHFDAPRAEYYEHLLPPGASFVVRYNGIPVCGRVSPKIKKQSEVSS